MTTRFDSAGALGFFWAVFTARPIVFIGLAIWTIVYTAGLGALQYAPTAAYMDALNNLSNTDDPAVVFATVGSFYAASGPIWLLGIAGYILLETAWLRLFVRGEGNPVFPFKLSKDEGMFTLTGLALVGIMIGAYIGWIVVAMIAATVIALALAPISATVATAAVFIAMFALALPFFWVMIRFSPALAMAVDRRAFVLGEAWSGTKGWFWSMLGSYLIAFLVMLVIGLVGLAVLFVMGYNLIGISAGVTFPPFEVMLAFYIVQAVIALIPQAMFRGIAVRAAQQIGEAGSPPATPADGGGG
ncbi:hypothetical protein [Hyphobacterium marinum]|uniref:Glycerophosphoryl diester phosphodiesterase membrane domain-containing protein n=1 Tax=Hyphobacterium marinum TaxID=3116574 RepID=A0ABU7M1E8_9PROT|nr:hypothetical protein [Hyphobacterium sp. Y6023]MEE2567642.1 hypothetical protein [Hyphobacterium sp. Y6023]